MSTGAPPQTPTEELTATVLLRPQAEFKGRIQGVGGYAPPPCWRSGNLSLIFSKFGHLIELILILGQVALLWQRDAQRACQ